MEIFLTVHTKRRMSERIISENEIVEALSNGVAEQDAENPFTFIVEYQKVRIVFAHSGECVTIITVMPSRSFRKELRKYVRRNKISYKKAAKELKNVA